MPARHPHQHEDQPAGPQARQGEFVTPRNGPQPQPRTENPPPVPGPDGPAAESPPAP